MQLEVLVQTMRTILHTSRCAILAAGLLISGSAARAQDNSKTPSSYMPVDIHESFSTILSRMTAAKPEIMKRHMALLEQRYDLSNHPAQGAKMSGGKAVQQGVRVKLASGTTWDQLSKLSPEQIKERNLFPAGFLPLPHPNHPEGGMLFPKFEIDEIKKQEGRDLTRFDLDFDFPDHLIPEFPPPIYLTTRVDLGDVSHGKFGHHGQLLRVVQRHSESEAVRGLAPAIDYVRAATVQCHRRPALGTPEPGSGMLRLPRERSHQSSHPPGGRLAATGVPASDQHAVAARGEYSTLVRLAASAEDH